MSKGKSENPKGRGRNELSLVRSSAAEYLTFVAAGGSSETSVEMRYEGENVWLTQKMMATLYDVSVPAINQHLRCIFDDNELEEAAVIKQYLITAGYGKKYQVKHYNLQAIIGVGFKIENERAVQFVGCGEERTASFALGFSPSNMVGSRNPGIGLSQVFIPVSRKTFILKIGKWAGGKYPWR